MRHLLKLCADHPWTVFLLLAVCTVVAATRLPALQVHISAEGMLEKDTLAWQRFTEAERVFGSEDTAIVVLRDPELFSAGRLTAIRDQLRAIEALPFVSHTLSLFDIPNLKNIDGTIHSRPYLESLPADPAQAAAIVADALRNPLVRGNLLSSDGQTMAIDVFLRRAPGDATFDRDATAAIEAAIAPLRDRVDEVFQVGVAAMRADLTDKIRSDQREFLPLSVLVLLATLAFMLRRATAALIPLATAGLSVVWTLGFLAATGIPINIMTSIVPALVIIIGSTEDIHLIAEYAAGIRDGADRRAAIERMAERMGTAVLLTFVTTYVGFLSIALNDIELLVQFGVAASTGLLFNFAITTMLVPAILARLGHTRPHRAASRKSALFQRIAVGLMLTLRRHRAPVFIGATLLALVSLLAATQLRINNNFLDYLDAHSALRSHAEITHERLSGVHAFSIIVDGGIDNTFLQVKYLKALRDIQHQVDAQGGFDRSFSFADFVGLLNGVMADDGTGTEDLPESDDLVREYMLFIKQRDVAAYVSPQYDRARILVRHNITSSDQFNRAIAALQTAIDRELVPGLRVEITGQAVLSNRAVEEMAIGQLQSLLLVSLVIVGLVSVLFVSLRAGLIALVPNLFPVAVLFGVMAVTGIPLNAGTSMIAAIALGICVDDTLHVMARFREELRVRAGRRAALVAMLRAEAPPLFATSLALAAGFAVFAVSSFQPVVQFGVLSAMVMLVALAATFVLTPLLLGTTELLTVWDLLSCRIQNEAVRASPLFAGMYLWQVKKILLASDIRRYSPGEPILHQGNEGSEMYLVLEGRVEVRRHTDEGTTGTLRTIGVGELFGEVAPLSGGRRTADVVATRDTRVVVLSWRRIDRLTHRYPILAYRLFRNLTRIVGARLLQTQEYRLDRRDTEPGA